MNNLSIGKRLGLGFGLMLAAAVTMALTGNWAIGTFADETLAMLRGDATAAEHSARARANATALRQYEKDVFLNIEKPDKVAGYVKKWEAQYASVLSRIDTVDATVTSAEDKQAVSKIRRGLAGYKEGFNRVLDKIRDQEIQTPAQGNQAIKRYKDPVRMVAAESKALAGRYVKKMHGKEALFSELASDVRVVLALILLAALVVGVVVGFVITRGITLPIRQLTDAAGCVADGDLDQEVEISSGDEIGELATSFQNMVSSLRENRIQERRDAELAELAGAEVTAVATRLEAGELEARTEPAKVEGSYQNVLLTFNSALDALVKPLAETGRVLDELAHYDLRARVNGDYRGGHAKIKDAVNTTSSVLHDAISQVAEAVEQITSAGDQIASSAQSVAQGSSEQASSLEETSSSLEEMAGMTKQNLENTKAAQSLAETAKRAANDGNASMATMAEAMQKIRSSSQGTAQIISDINEIAFQTNLLALNAAVEAARAGDAGRGFAVVAEEVRNLALRSKEAAKKTELLIKESVETSAQGVDISNQVNANLGEIVTTVDKVADIVGEVAAASDEQAQGIDQVNRAVAEMDRVVQQAAANSEESSSAAEELSGQAQELFRLVQQFRLERGTSRQQQIESAPAPVKRPAGGNGSAAVASNTLGMDALTDAQLAEF